MKRLDEELEGIMKAALQRNQATYRRDDKREHLAIWSNHENKLLWNCRLVEEALQRGILSSTEARFCSFEMLTHAPDNGLGTSTKFVRLLDMMS